MVFLKKVWKWSLLLMSSATLVSAEPLEVSVRAESAILINAASGTVLFSKSEETLCSPASIVKVATAAFALKEKGSKLEEMVVVEKESLAMTTVEAKKKTNYTLPAYWLEPNGTNIGLREGESMPFKDLLTGMLVASGNDAANTVAQFTSGKIPTFMKNMNLFLKEIGCRKTVFHNPHGLHHPDQVTTALEMALITRYALNNPHFSAIVASTRFIRPKTNKQTSSVLPQTNKLLRKSKFYYPKAIGVKTGYTSFAQNNLVAAAKQEDRLLIAVLLKSKQRDEMFEDARLLFETAFKEKLVKKRFLRDGNQEYSLLLEGADRPVKTFTTEPLELEYYPSEEPQVKAFLSWEAISLPIQSGQKVGQLELRNKEGKPLSSAPLFAQEDVNETWSNWFKGLIFGQ